MKRKAMVMLFCALVLCACNPRMDPHDIAAVATFCADRGLQVWVQDDRVECYAKKKD